MCRLDEESGLLGGGRRQGGAPSAMMQLLRATVVGGIGFAVGILVMRQDSTPIGTTPALVLASPVTTSKYTKFQPLSFQLYTGGAPVKISLEDGTNASNLECSDLSTFGSFNGVMHCYMGHKNNTHDVIDRLAIMEDAVERAYELSDKSADTLKVFVAPEFFFRGRNGAYIMRSDQESLFNDVDGQCRSEVCQILMTLEKLVGNAKYEDWIFLFGTAVLSESLQVEDTWDYLFYNFGILFKGFDPDKTTHHGKRFLVPKRYVSNLDFLTPYRSIVDTTREVYQSIVPDDEQAVLNPHNLKHEKYNRLIWHTYKEEIANLGYTMIEYGWFIIEGITLTVEICLDHDMRTVLTAFLADAASREPTLIPSYANDQIDFVEIPKHQAQISIVSSADMQVTPTALALINGGTIILQDGMNEDEANMTWEYECYKYDWQFTGGSQVVQRNASITPTEVVFNYQVNRDYGKHSIYSDWKKSMRGVFSTAKYEPMISSYEPKPLAAF